MREKFLTMIAKNLKDPIQCLPDEILISILSYLPYSDLIAAQRVSKGWLHYLVTDPYLHRHVSFLDSKHQITLKTLRSVLAMANGRVSYLAFNADTLMHLTPLVLIYPHLQQLIIAHKTGIMSTIFNIAFQSTAGTYHILPNLRTAIFRHGTLLNNEIVTLFSMAPNLEEFECRRAVVWLDNFERLVGDIKDCKIKRLAIKGYSERAARGEWGSTVPLTLNRSPTILRHLPLLEELALGLDTMQVLDLTSNSEIRYLDFLPDSPVVSFNHPPPGLEICLNAPVLSGRILDTTPFFASPPIDLLNDKTIQLWRNPPQFRSLSIGLLPFDILSPTLSNSLESLEAFGVNFGNYTPSKIPSPFLEIEKTTFMFRLPELLVLFQNLHFLDVSESGVGDTFLNRITTLQLNYLSLAHTLVTSDGILEYLSKSPGTLTELNAVGIAVGLDLGDVAQKRGVKMESEYPGKPMPGARYSLY